MNKAAASEQQSVISLESYCDLLEESEVQSTLDMGSALLHKVLHPKLGNIVLVSTTSHNGMMHL